MELKPNRVCDFCGNPNTIGIFWFKSQTIPAGTPIDVLMALTENPEWFACEACTNHVKTNNLVALLNNVPELQRPFFTVLYQSLLQNVNSN